MKWTIIINIVVVMWPQRYGVVLRLSCIELNCIALHCISTHIVFQFLYVTASNKHKRSVNFLPSAPYQHFQMEYHHYFCFFFVWIYFLHCCCYKTYNKWKHFRIHLKSKCVSHLTQTMMMMMIFNFTFFSQPIKWFHIYLIGFEPL